MVGSPGEELSTGAVLSARRARMEAPWKGTAAEQERAGLYDAQSAQDKAFQITA